MSPIKLSSLNKVLELPDSATRVEKLFDWYFERHRLITQVTIAFLGAFLAALIVATLRGDFGDNWVIVLLVTVLVVLGTGSLIVRSYLKMRNMEDDYVAALELVK